MKTRVAILVGVLYSLNAYAVYHEPTIKECLSRASGKEEELLCRNLESQRLKYPSRYSPNNKYLPDGHLYTTFIVLKSAGLKDSDVYDISYCSQLPDDNKWFSATLAFFYPDIEYRNGIMATIHSLHGGDEEAVRKRRASLKLAVKEAWDHRSLSNCDIGIMIHAFADSYAHTYEKDGTERAYGPFLGHLLHANEPDIIAYYPDKFLEYAEQLFSIFRSAETEKLPEGFSNKIRILSTDRLKAVQAMETYALGEYNLDPSMMAEYQGKWKNEETKEDMKRLIGYIESKI